MGPGEHRTLRIVLLIYGLVDLCSGLLLFIYPQAVAEWAPPLTINYFAERIMASALLAVGGANLRGWIYTERRQFVELLVLKVMWAASVVLSFIITIVQRSESVSIVLLLFMGSFVLDTATYTGFLLNYSARKTK